ncbi:MAG: hypothetical protein ACI9F9_001312 [Candidatus Paceibacteria bacterium]|jgi:hypothetical protein
MVTPWNTGQQQNNQDLARSGPTSSANVMNHTIVKVSFERWLGVALWAGLVGVMVWNGAA